AELGRMVAAIAFGLLAAALLAVPVSGLVDSPQARTGALLAAVPLSLSMGAAEWSLLWYRERTQQLLRGTASLKVFRRRAQWILLGGVAQYLLAAALLTAAAVAIATGAGMIEFDPAMLPATGAYLALGGAMFLALLLQALGDYKAALLACA